MNERRSYTVSQINRYIKNQFASDYVLNHICIKGEVSNCKYHSSGHIYFTIKDAASQLSCVMFAGQRKGLTFRMEEGQSVLVSGSISVYERDGKYQLYANEITREGTGVLYEQFEKRKQALEEEGLFAADHKKPIPFYVKKLGIVTAATGAAIQDIIQISSRRNPYCQLVLYPAKVQGEGAAQSVADGLRYLDRYGVDVIIAGRGGGSIEDLWAFNEELVARTIYNCNTPVISAVGHETDVTIADYVADLRAPTPSAAAELAVCQVEDVFDQIDAIQVQLTGRMEQKIQMARKNTALLKSRLDASSPKACLERKKHLLESQRQRLDIGMNRIYSDRKHHLELLVGELRRLSPLEKLSGGYAYVTASDKEALRSISQVNEGDRIHVTLKDGSLYAQVTEMMQKGTMTCQQKRKQNQK